MLQRVLLYLAARLLRERDSYRSRLETMQAAAPAEAAAANGKRAAETPAADAAGSEEPAGKKARPALGSAVVDALTAKSAELSKMRKKREISPGVASPEDIAAYELLGSYPVHATRKGGIHSLAVSPTNDAVVASAGGDTTVQLFDCAAQQTLASLTGHSKKVLDVAFVGSQKVIASSSADKTVRLWRQGAAEDAPYECAAVIEDGGEDVVAVKVHPTNDYMLTANGDGSWALYDVAQAECLARVRQEGDAPAAYTSAALHPDGLILCTGTAAATCKVWEVRTQKCVATFDGHRGPVTSLSFSENGYYMASAAADGVKLWDLRKLKNFRSIAPYGEEAGAAAATAVSFDHSGLFLAVGGADARVYGVKQDWDVVKVFDKLPKKGASAVAWGTDARSLLVGCPDHNLRVFGAAP